ncbi:MAG: DUF6152 family protein [Steroidobacteraceae bacterium]
MKIQLSLSVLLLATAMTTTYAHHSGAMFDSTQSLIVEGVVKDWQWKNPHAWLQIVTPDGKGGTVEQGFELGSPNTLVRNGYEFDTFKSGDKVKVVYHPRKDGTLGGELSWVKAVNGTWLKWVASGDHPAD